MWSACSRPTSSFVVRLAKLSSADSLVWGSLYFITFEYDEDCYLRPVIDMRVRCGEWDQPPDFATTVHWQPQMPLISHSGQRTLRRKETQFSSILLTALLGLTSQTVRYSTLLYIVDGLSWRLLNVSAKMALNKMAVKYQAIWCIWTFSPKMQVFSLHSTSNS